MQTEVSHLKSSKAIPPRLFSAGDPPEPASTQFFYIGKNNARINFLISAFDSGYAAENISGAISILQRLSGKPELPDFIIAEHNFSVSELLRLYRCLHSHTGFSAIPLVLDISGLSASEIRKYREIRFLDELIVLEGMGAQRLLSKMRFLGKIKHRSEQLRKAKLHAASTGIPGQRNLSKRAFDVMIAALALIVLSPLFLLIASAIKLESDGPVFYIAKRAGRGYRIFHFFKFRTMILDADQKRENLASLNQYPALDESSPLFYKYSNDPRITRIGRLLRSTSMDELPQFINVLLGDMSLVGNRPLPLYEASRLTTDELAARFMAPVGMTGLWQIKKQGFEQMSVEERISLDIDYADNNNFLYDLWIMANTPSAMLQKINA